MYQEVQAVIKFRVSGRNANNVDVAAAATRDWMRTSEAATELMHLILECIKDEAPDLGDDWFYSLVRIEVDGRFVPVSAYFTNAN